MLRIKWRLNGLVLGMGLIVLRSGFAVEFPPPQITGAAAVAGQKQIQWGPYPAAVQYKILRAPTALGPFSEDKSGAIVGQNWSGSLTSGLGFYRLEVESMKSEDLLATQVLNRLAYGPTPDELERVKAIGAAAYIREQLAPETIQENLAIDALPSGGGPSWQ